MDKWNFSCDECWPAIGATPQQSGALHYILYISDYGSGSNEGARSPHFLEEVEFPASIRASAVLAFVACAMTVISL